jgi:hypothetical protein
MGIGRSWRESRRRGRSCTRALVGMGVGVPACRKGPGAVSQAVVRPPEQGPSSELRWFVLAVLFCLFITTYGRYLQSDVCVSAWMFGVCAGACSSALDGCRCGLLQCLYIHNLNQASQLQGDVGGSAAAPKTQMPSRGTQARAGCWRAQQFPARSFTS